jgi:diamine N-acetyltransferase
VPEARAAQPGDIDRLLSWMQQLYATDSIAYDEVKARPAVARLIEDPSLGQVWLLTENNTPVGYLVVCFGYSLEFGGRDAFIDELFVAEEHRGQGIGRWAVRFAAQACKQQGINALHLEVDHGNTRAQLLYRSEGFVDHDRYLMTRHLR